MLMIVLLLSPIYFISSRFEHYRHDFEQFVSKLVKQPVKVGAIAVGSRGLEPVLKLQNVIISNDAKTRKILQAQELQIGIDLVGSLLQWQIKPGLLLIRGGEFTVYQDENGQIGVKGVVATTPGEDKIDSMYKELSSWLFEQSRIYLEDIVLNWRLPNGNTLKITDLSLKLDNSVLQHNLKIKGKLKQKNFPAAVFKAKFKLQGDFLNNSLFPLGGEIKLDNLVFDLDLNDAKFSSDSFLFPPKGDVSLLVENSRIATKIFRQPMLINSMSGKVFWRRDNKGLAIDISGLKFADNYLNFQGESQLLFFDKAVMPEVDIRLKFKLNNLAKAKLYYPVTVLPPNATIWLDQAFTKSKTVSGDMILKGPLDKFPFDNNEGEFLVDSTIRDVCLHYDRDWPLVEKINGKMVFANRTMTILANSARIMGGPTKFIKTTIPDLEFPVLYVEGAIDTTSDLGLKFIQACPLKDTVGRKLQDISLAGPMKFNLKMKMPLSDAVADQNTQVVGDIELTNNNLHSKELGFAITNMEGDLHFNNGDLNSNAINGKLFAKPINMTIQTLNPDSDDTVTRINIAGNAGVKDFERVFSVKLSSYASGNFDYRGALDLHSIALRNTFKLDSSLLGVAVRLPEPFAKKATKPSKFNLTCCFGGNKLPHVNVNYNKQINAALVVKKEGVGYLKVLAGEIKFGTEPAKISTTSGLVISGNLAKLDWPTWKKYLEKAHASASEAAGIIRQIGLNITELRVLGQIFRNLSLVAKPQEGGWGVELLMPDVNGKLYFPDDSEAAVRGEFSKLYFSEDEQQSPTEFKPRDLPPLNFKINNLRYGQKYLSRVTFITEPRDDGLNINRVTINTPKFSVEGKGEWLATSDEYGTIFRGKIRSNDVGGLLKQYDITDAMIGGKGEASFILKWPESPYNPVLQTIRGNCSLHIKDGRIIHLSRETESKLGFGRVLGMLSLQSIPRRLSLDFSDLTQKGFGFSTMQGNFELKSGNILVRKLHIDGSVVDVKAYGRIGLKNQDYDMLLSAIPQITSSIPIAATIAGGPVIGAISLVADKIISTAIKKAAVYKYRVTGRWAKPNIDVAGS